MLRIRSPLNRSSSCLAAWPRVPKRINEGACPAPLADRFSATTTRRSTSNMPFDVKAKHGARALAAALSVTALFAAPAHAGTVANPYDCAPQPVLTQAFSAWGDSNLYTPVPNAGLESGATGWTLARGAGGVSRSETFHIASGADSHSLDLPAGASAITAPLCIDETYPHFRIYGRNTGAATG